LLVQWLFVASWIPGSKHRCTLLRLFGGKVGHGVAAKPGLKVKFPWKFTVGDYVWLGEDVWIDNLTEVEIGNHVCISQGAYLCTGSHDWGSETFDLITRPITVEDKAWVGAQAVLAPGTLVREAAVVGLGSVVGGELNAWHIYQGNPAVAIRERKVDGR